MREHSKYIKNILTVLAGAFFLASFALYNKFPFIYTDTGTYLASGFDFVVPLDRPIYYGLFLRHVSLHENLWFVIIAQCVILSFVLAVMSRFIFNLKRLEFLMVVIFISVFTGVGLPAGHLIPDIFAPILIISLALMISGKIPAKYKTVLAFIVVLSIIMHISHLAIGLVLILGYILYGYIVNKKVLIFRKVLLVVVLALVIIPTGHYFMGGSFSFSEKSYLFHLNRLAENGLLDRYLKEECPTKEMELCAFQGQIPGNFLWDVNNSPLYILGGWDANETEYRDIVHQIHMSPKYWDDLGIIFFMNGLKQCFNFDLFEVHPVNGDRVNNLIGKYLPHQLREAKSGYQESAPERIYKYAYIKDAVFYFLLPLCLIYLMIFWPQMNPHIKSFVSIILIMVIVNAFVTGGLSTVVPRYQNRVIWLIPFIALSILFPTMRRRAIG